MGPLEKAFVDRKYNQGRSDTDEHQRIWRHLDAMSDHIRDTQKMVNPHAEALRVAVEALEALKHSIEPSDSDLADKALARIKEIMGETK